MKLSVIIPIYNEEKLIEQVLKRVRKLPYELELILVNDASIDGTLDILKKEVETHPENTTLLNHELNRGKGAAIRTGLKKATGDIVIIQDADLEYNPEEIPSVIQPILDGKTNVAYGSRFMGDVKKMRLANYIANKFLALLVSILYGQKITDEATAYKAFKRPIIQNIDLKCQGFEFCPEVTAKVLRKGEKIIEVPVTFTARSFWEGKKIGWKDFFVAVCTLLKYRFVK